jgi:membrane-associated protease RseP (regulator of RpoE activity)
MRGFGILIFVFFVLLAIAIHELGHFATAKWFKIKVDKFFIGFGPKLWSVKRGETEYGISAFPLGGYVKIAGMNPLEEIPPEDLPRTFKAKPAWQRAIVLVAGSVTHFIVALVILAAILAIAGEKDYGTATLEIRKIGSETPGEITASQRAGMKPGDRIVSVAGQPVTQWSQVQEAITARAPGQRLDIVVERDGRELALTATLGERERDGQKIAFLGVSPEFAVIDHSAGGAIIESGRQVGIGMWQSLVAFKNVFAPSNLNRLFQVAIGRQERSETDPSSLVGVGRLSGDAASEGDFASLFLIIVSFNIFVGVVNLVPLPPLDGGHLAVLGFEKLTRREVDVRRLLPITAMVLSALGMLFLLLLYTDIVNPLRLPG